MMEYNYHTHTKRCGHAIDEDEDYVKRAIAAGIKRLGFSDHIPLRFPDGYESGYRIPTSEATDYFSSLRSLRKKYEGEIDILIGFETEYYPKYFAEMLKYAKDVGAEYLILGQHYLYNEYPSGAYSGTRTSSEDILCEYVEETLAGMETGVFTYLAHPDLINYAGNDALYKNQMRKICEKSLALNMPLEINFLGIRSHRNYPNRTFWEICSEVGAPVTFGSDAHTAISTFDEESLQFAERLVGELGLNYIGEPQLINII